MMKKQELLEHVSKATDAVRNAEKGDPADEKRACDMLATLRKASVTAALLLETKAGFTLRTISKSSNKAIAAAAKLVVDEWKAIFARDIDKNKPGGGGGEEKKKTATPPSPTNADRAKPNPATTTTTTTTTATATVTTTTIIKKHSLTTTGTKRDGYINSFADLLSQEMDRVENCSPSAVAIAVEEAVARRYAALSTEYNDKFRSIMFNIRDPDNWDLRTRVLLGEITPSELICMSDAELASQRVRLENDRLQKEVMEKAVIHEHARGQRTAMYECPKCKKKDCSFYEKQTRSADEPMTVFVECLNCGKKWRMN